jgi:hypothetical protein
VTRNSHSSVGTTASEKGLDIRVLYESSFLNLFPGVNRISESGISSHIYTT